MEIRDFLEKAGTVKPTQRQIDHMNDPFYAFVHFGMNSVTSSELGSGKEDEKIFNPVDLDCDEWVEAIKSAGMTGAILTAKHHDGFCLWQTKYTEHSIKNSPFRGGKGDIVKELSEACARGGIRFGVYLSPWDRNSAFYGSEEYNDYYKKQLTELLTDYGELFEVWFDGACFEGSNGRKQQYDYDGYIDLIRKYQPNACIFNDHGPDVRWVGNESGTARGCEWATVPAELCHRVRENAVEIDGLEGSLAGIYNTDSNIGDLSQILYSKRLVCCPSEIDMSIRPGWFYHREEEPHSLERLFGTYLHSVGGNACFNLNIPPMANGRFNPRDIARLKELGDTIKRNFSLDLAPNAGCTVESAGWGQTDFVYDLGCKKKIGYVELRENMVNGQRIEAFEISCFADGEWRKYAHGTTVGFRKFVPVNAWLSKIRVSVKGSRGQAELLPIRAFAQAD